MGGAVGAHGNRQAAEHGRTRTDSAHISEEAHHGEHHDEGGSFGSLLQGLAGAHAEGPLNGSGHAAAGTPHGEAAAPEAHPQQNGLQGAHARGSVPANDPVQQAERTLVDVARTPQTQQLIDRMNTLREHIPGTPQLNNIEQLSLHTMDQVHQRMYGATLDQLEALQAGRINNRQYFTNVLQSAANIAGDDRDRFVELAHFSLQANEPLTPTGMALGLVRNASGGGYNIGASTQDYTQNRILRNNPEYRSPDSHGRMQPDLQLGFDPHVQETQNAPGGGLRHANDVNRSNTETHHFIEFLRMGYSVGPGVAGLAQDLHDSPADNPADNRSGHFGAMLGSALRDGRITNQDVVNLATRAFTSNESTMWPETNINDARHWNIQDWVSEYNSGAPTHAAADLHDRWEQNMYAYHRNAVAG